MGSRQSKIICNWRQHNLLNFSKIKRKKIIFIYKNPFYFLMSRIHTMPKTRLVVDEGDSISTSSKSACYISYQSAVLSSEYSITCNHSREWTAMEWSKETSCTFLSCWITFLTQRLNSHFHTDSWSSCSAKLSIEVSKEILENEIDSTWYCSSYTYCVAFINTKQTQIIARPTLKITRIFEKKAIIFLI